MANKLMVERAKAIRNFSFPIEDYESMCPGGFEDVTPELLNKPIKTMAEERLEDPFYDKIIEEMEQYDHWEVSK